MSRRRSDRISIGSEAEKKSVTNSGWKKSSALPAFLGSSTVFGESKTTIFSVGFSLALTIVVDFTVPVAATVAPERPQPTRNCQWQGWLEKGGMEGVGRVVKLQQRPVVQKRTPLSCEKGGRSGRDGEEKPGSASPTADSPSPSSPSPPTAAATAAPRQLPFRSERSTTSDPSLLQLMIQPKSFSAATLSRRNFFRGQKPLLGLS